MNSRNEDRCILIVKSLVILVRFEILVLTSLEKISGVDGWDWGADMDKTDPMG